LRIRGASSAFLSVHIAEQGVAMKILFLLMWLTGSAQTPALRWLDFHSPEYPQMARVANIDGSVTVEFTIQPGKTLTVQKSAGHPILVQAAVESLKLSRLACDNCQQEAANFSVLFVFKVEGECGNSGGSPRAVLEDSNHITISTNRFCTVNPAFELRKRVRSIRCLYLWKCLVRRD
jgi:TonB family protein